MRSYYTYVFLLCASPSVLRASDILNVCIKSSDNVEHSVPAEPLERYSVLWQGYKEVWLSAEHESKEFYNHVHSLPYTSEKLALESIVGILQQADALFRNKSGTYVQLAEEIPSYDKESEMIKTLESAYIFRLDERILKALALKCVSDKKESVLDLCSQVPNSVNHLIGQFYLKYCFHPGLLPLEFVSSLRISSTDLVAHNKFSINSKFLLWIGRRIASVDGADLPQGVEMVALNYNQLSSLPDNLPKSIIWLHLRNNKLTNLPDNIPEGIKQLDLRENPLTPEAKENIKKRLPNATIIFDN